MHGNERASATLSHLMSIPFVTHPHFQPHIPKTTRAPSHRRTPRFRGELRTLATTKPILEQEKDFASALAPTKPNLERGNVANQTENAETPQTKLRTTKSPHTRATPPGRTRASHVLRALAPTKPNLERGNVASAYFKSRLNTFSTPIVESGPCPGIITVSFDIMRSFERIPLRRVFLA